MTRNNTDYSNVAWLFIGTLWGFLMGPVFHHTIGFAEMDSSGLVLITALNMVGIMTALHFAIVDGREDS